MLNWIVRNRTVCPFNCVYKYICKNRIWHEVIYNGWYAIKHNQTKLTSTGYNKYLRCSMHKGKEEIFA